MDISELPFFAVVLLVLVAFVAVFFVAKRLSKRWLRWPVRSVASVGTALTVVMGALFVFGEYSCTARAPLAYSPDGKYVAVLTWGLQGALGADMATVKVRRHYSPFAEKVYSGPGDSDYPDGRATDPQVQWTDNKHLLIRYGGMAGYEVICRPHADEIEVICDPFHSQFAPPSHGR